MTAPVAPVWSAPGSRLDELPAEQRLGTWAVWLVIVTEALLFGALLFSYFYVGRGRTDWPPHPPKRATALVLLTILLVSSAVVEGAKRALGHGREGAARLGLVGAAALGAGFLGLQASEYAQRLREAPPWSDAYGSLFFAITGFHGLHVLVGVIMLVAAACLPLRGEHAPHRPLENVALYWHFVDVVWLALVIILYLLPGGPA